MAGMDDREDPDELITMEAMNGLARIFDRIDEGHVRPILINIALRIRPCFEKVYTQHITVHNSFLNVSFIIVISPQHLYEPLLLICLVHYHNSVMAHQRVPSLSRYKLILLVSCFILTRQIQQLSWLVNHHFKKLVHS